MTNYATTPSKQYLHFHGFLRIPTTTNGERRLCVIDRFLFYFKFIRKCYFIVHQLNQIEEGNNQVNFIKESNWTLSNQISLLPGCICFDTRPLLCKENRFLRVSDPCFYRY